MMMIPISILFTVYGAFVIIFKAVFFIKKIGKFGVDFFEYVFLWVLIGPD